MLPLPSGRPTRPQAESGPAAAQARRLRGATPLSISMTRLTRVPSSSGISGHVMPAEPQRGQTQERQQEAEPVEFLLWPLRHSGLSSATTPAQGCGSGVGWRHRFSSRKLYGGAFSDGSRSSPRRLLSSLSSRSCSRSSRSCSLHARCSSKKLRSSDTHNLVMASSVRIDRSLHASFSFCRDASERSRSRSSSRSLRRWLELLWSELS